MRPPRGGVKGETALMSIALAWYEMDYERRRSCKLLSPTD